MKTLLTGANGLVGSTIPADYKLNGKRLLDLTDWTATYRYFKEIRPERVIHTAAKVGGLGANMAHMGEFFYDNMMINLNVLEASRQTGVKKVVSFLSTCIFPDEVEYPITEDKLHLGEPHSSNYGYAYAKRMLEVQSRAYNQQYGVELKGNKMCFNTKYLSVIPTNIYGPNDNFNLESSHVVPATIHKCYLAKRDDIPLWVWGDGTPLREFIYSEDVGELTQLVLDHYENDNPLILSTGEEHSIRQLVIAVADAMDFQGQIIYDANKPNGQHRKPTSNLLLKNFVPEYKFTPFEEGIKKTVDWFVENYEACRK